MEESKNQELWKVAIKRAKFKRHLVSYFIINAFLWAIWYMTAGIYSENLREIGIPWPAWATLGWGIGLAFNYFEAYHVSGMNAIQKEYEKLLNEKK